jgi:hypothetical protein
MSHPHSSGRWGAHPLRQAKRGSRSPCNGTCQSRQRCPTSKLSSGHNLLATGLLKGYTTHPWFREWYTGCQSPKFTLPADYFCSDEAASRRSLPGGRRFVQAGFYPLLRNRNRPWPEFRQFTAHRFPAPEAGPCPASVRHPGPFLPLFAAGPALPLVRQPGPPCRYSAGAAPWLPNSLT